ncbi:MAG: RtcB family protein [Phycisphaerae bacterium]|nr:RtcB family protein [Phycisphaerae bacterium]
MEKAQLERRGPCEWVARSTGTMNVPVILFADEGLIEQMDLMVLQQATNVARLPGIVGASMAMPDAHWGYGFPIGGVGAFDPAAGGVVSAGGVGFDIACGVRALRTGLKVPDVEAVKSALADLLAGRIPAGVGSRGKLKLSMPELDAMLSGGAHWAVDRGYGTPEDLRFIEENGRMAAARPRCVSDHAKRRQEEEVGTLGSGNHYLEIQKVTRIYDAAPARAFGIAEGDVLVSIHCGSRGLGHQVGADFLPRMVKQAKAQGIDLPEKELACARIDSDLGQEYLGAMNSGINCAVANRQVLTHLVRLVFADILPKASLTLLYDVSHNTCKLEEHEVAGMRRQVYVHRKGATRSYGPGHAALPTEYRAAGQPVLIGGTMGTASYILAGTAEAMARSFGSCCHGAGRAMSRTAALRQWQGRDVVRDLDRRNILIRGASARGIAEEAPGAYKDVHAVVQATEGAGLAKKVAMLEPLICVKG